MSFSRLFLSIIFAMLIYLFPQKGIAQKFLQTSISGNNGKTTIQFKNNDNSFKIEYEGDISLTEDDRDVAYISDGGFIEISKTAFGSKRTVRIESGRNGRMNREYYVGRRQVDYDGEGRRWLAEILPEVVRSSVIGAEARVDRYYNQGGATALLQEIRRLKGDYVRHAYCDLAIQKRLSTSQIVTLLQIAGNEIDSDFYLSKLLKEHTERFLSDQQTLDAYIHASRNISSDFHKAEVMTAAINHARISSDHLRQLLDITGDISSDYHKAEVLKLLLREHTLTLNNVDQVMRAVEHIDSDFHIDEVLSALLANQLDEQSLGRLYNLVGNNVSSDFHKDQVLSKAINQQNVCGSNLFGLTNALRSIDSDFHQAHVMVKIGKEVDLTDDDLINLLGTVDNIDSDFHKGEVLSALAPQVNSSGDEAYRAFMRAAKLVSSQHEYGKIMRSLEERGRYQEE